MLGRCLTFWYFISGQVTAGFLIVSLKNIKTNQVFVLWKYGGVNLGDQWNYGSFGFYMEDPYIIVFTAQRGGSPGIVGLDDIIFKESQFCSINPMNASTGTSFPLPMASTSTKKPVVITSDLDCDFEVNLCNWKNVLNAKINWKRNQGTSGMSQTGPLFDHT